VLFLAPGPEWRAWLGAALMGSLVGLGALMVSTFRYPSFKQIDLRARRSYRFAVPLAALILIVVYWPQAFLAGAAVIYTLWGPAVWLIGRLGWGRSTPSLAEEELESSP
jgi:CDP-diacylglycerol--serine O-phosphatidyltransferase